MVRSVLLPATPSLILLTRPASNIDRLIYNLDFLNPLYIPSSFLMVSFQNIGRPYTQIRTQLYLSQLIQS